MGFFSWLFGKKKQKGKLPKGKKVLSDKDAGKVKGGKSNKRIWNGCGGTIPQ